MISKLTRGLFMSSVTQSQQSFLNSFIHDCYSIDSSKDSLLEKIGKVALMAIAATVVGFLLTMAVYAIHHSLQDRTVEPVKAEEPKIPTKPPHPLDFFNRGHEQIRSANDRAKRALTPAQILDPAKQSVPWAGEDSL